MKDCELFKTPAEVKLKLKTKHEDEFVNEHLCRSLVGSLLYLAKQTRPAIVWIVNAWSRSQDGPKFEHWNAG